MSEREAARAREEPRASGRRGKQERGRASDRRRTERARAREEEGFAEGHGEKGLAVCRRAAREGEGLHDWDGLQQHGVG